MIELLWWIHATGAGQPRSLRHGTGSLIEAVQSGLTVHLQSDVTRLERMGTGVAITVKGRDGQSQVHQADACLVTVPGTIAAELCGDLLTDAQRGSLLSRRYDRSIVVSFCTRHRPDLAAPMFLAPDELSVDLATIIFAHNIGPQRIPPGMGVINAYFMKSWSDRYVDQDDESIMKAAQAHIVSLIPEVADITDWHVQRWSHTAAKSETGDCAKMKSFDDAFDVTLPIPFMGDYQAQASMNVAIANAERAAEPMGSSQNPS